VTHHSLYGSSGVRDFNLIREKKACNLRQNCRSKYVFEKKLHHKKSVENLFSSPREEEDFCTGHGKWCSKTPSQHLCKCIDPSCWNIQRESENECVRSRVQKHGAIDHYIRSRNPLLVGGCCKQVRTCLAGSGFEPQERSDQFGCHLLVLNNIWDLQVWPTPNLFGQNWYKLWKLTLWSLLLGC